MNQSKIVISLFLPTNEQSTEAIHPAMGAFHYPTSASVAWNPLLGTGLFSTSFDMGYIFPFRHQLTNLWIVITFVQAYVLRILIRYHWSLNCYRSQCRFHKLHIVTVSSINHHCQWNTMSFCQHTAFSTQLTTVSGITSGFFFHPMALWSLRHPWIAIPSPILLAHRISQDQLPKYDETHLLFATPESDHEPCLMHPNCVEALSIDSQCVVCRIWHLLLFGCSSVDDHLWVWGALVAVMAPSLPKAHLVSYMTHLHPYSHCCLPLLVLHSLDSRNGYYITKPSFRIGSKLCKNSYFAP